MELYPGIPEPYSQRREEANLSGEVCRKQSQAVNIMKEAVVATFCIHWSIISTYSSTRLKEASLASAEPDPYEEKA